MRRALTAVGLLSLVLVAATQTLSLSQQPQQPPAPRGESKAASAQPRSFPVPGAKVTSAATQVAVAPSGPPAPGQSGVAPTAAGQQQFVPIQNGYPGGQFGYAPGPYSNYASPAPGGYSNYGNPAPGSYSNYGNTLASAPANYGNPISSAPYSGAFPNSVLGAQGAYSVPTIVGRPAPAGFLQPTRPVDMEELAKFHGELNRFRTVTSDEDKAEARENLSKMVASQLSRDIEQREKMLNDVEERVKEMRAQLEERKKSKDEIHKMLMLLIEQPQVGLGLPREWMNAIEPSGYSHSPLGTYPQWNTVNALPSLPTNQPATRYEPTERNNPAPSAKPTPEPESEPDDKGEGKEKS